MDAWILDESPGAYRWGQIDPPPLDADDVRIRVVTSALNHMDLWVTRGMPKPPLPHVPGCDVAGVVEEVGSEVSHVAAGDEVVVNPAVSPLEDIVALGNDSPMGPGFEIWGEHTWGGHSELATACSRLDSLRLVVITSAPRCLPRARAAHDTPEPMPTTRMVSPALIRARRSMR